MMVWFPGYFGEINTPSQESWLWCIIFMEENVLHFPMMGWRVMHCKVVSKIVMARGPEDIEVPLVALWSHTQ